MNGFVILDKGEGVTSFKAAACLRRIYGVKKTGHTGTLDPMATGVLPVALGKATRFIDFIPESDKGYRAKLKLGIVTDTLDITGTILSERKVNVTEEEFLSVLDFFRGDILQLPPMYSAIQKDGVRLYELARRGIEVEREKRAVTIKKIEYLGFSDGEFRIDVICSKGTYIRSLISDIGEKLSTGAVMTSLRRTLANGFTLSEAKTEKELETLREKALLGIDFPFMCYPSVIVSSNQARRFLNGGELSADRLHTEVKPSLYRVYSPENVFLGLGEVKQDDITTLWAKRVVGNDSL